MRKQPQPPGERGKTGLVAAEPRPERAGRWEPGGGRRAVYRTHAAGCQDERVSTSDADQAVSAAGRAAREGAGTLRRMTAAGLDEALRAMAARLSERAAAVLAANAEDVSAARAEGLAAAFVDRLALDDTRLQAMSEQLSTLAGVPASPQSEHIRDLPGGLELRERRRPVGVVGANFEARPNVVVDIASQLIKSRNAGVLRTGSSAIRSASVLLDEVVGPA